MKYIFINNVAFMWHYINKDMQKPLAVLQFYNVSSQVYPTEGWKWGNDVWLWKNRDWKIHSIFTLVNTPMNDKTPSLVQNGLTIQTYTNIKKSKVTLPVSQLNLCFDFNEI